MIIWINGPFGIGKTQCAYELQRRNGNLFLYDPETVGYFFRRQFPPEVQTDDFQDIPLWREFNFKILMFLARSYDRDIIVPMTITNKQYYDEIIGRLRENGVTVHHFILMASEKTLRRRLKSRLEGKNAWSVMQISRCLQAFSSDITEKRIDTEKLSIDEVAEAVADFSQITLAKGRKSKIGAFFSRLRVKWKNIRF